MSFEGVSRNHAQPRLRKQPLARLPFSRAEQARAAREPPPRGGRLLVWCRTVPRGGKRRRRTGDDRERTPSGPCVKARQRAGTGRRLVAAHAPLLPAALRARASSHGSPGRAERAVRAPRPPRIRMRAARGAPPAAPTPRPRPRFAFSRMTDRIPVMILPQVHLRKPCYDFSFL